MVDKVELKLKRRTPIGNRRRSQAAVAYVQSYIPPMVLQRRQSESNLSHNLRPHMQGVEGVLPLRQRQSRPELIRRLRCDGIRCLRCSGHESRLSRKSATFVLARCEASDHWQGRPCIHHLLESL